MSGRKSNVDLDAYQLFLLFWISAEAKQSLVSYGAYQLGNLFLAQQ